ncbi:endonuclease MutS2 [Sediminispirochaeta smaragdinae]|uniref:Endonuclease MutS2 n=1 Tax=Sediminispirochaeta smaragdinae (strain DSM 11293 / JCM 15392 / SEBR 4228) TaxID=573413 RepID=E1R3E8_SEDSS|nr:endonuclease MutS2 [Sediminispirochaeta smaragdinae]ADK81579.1 MutS2 family protein [Sediminispirochaeta smaragdinae DSM 11293]
MEKTVELLEFDKIRKELSARCFSEEGRTLLSGQRILTKRRECESLHDDVAALRVLMEQFRELPALSFPSITEALKELARPGSFVDGEHLYPIARYIQSAAILQDYVQEGSQELFPPQSKAAVFPAHLLELLQRLDPPRELASRIFSVLEADGSVKENHPELRTIRKRLGALRRELMEMSSRYMNESKDLWQNDVPSQKDGRLVLPLKAQRRGAVKGIIHDVSSKGAILYLEPFDILEKNNEVAIQEHELHQVVIKILRELSALVRDRLESLETLIPVIAEIDVIQARSRLSRYYQGIRPMIVDEGIRLKRARHPLLGLDAVPIDIELGGSVRSLIISGPNAGGKTVTLKTIGLLVLMHQFGIEIPAAEESELPVFRAVYADIGDDQSIEASLSTFSGHMRTIADIISLAQAHTLVLLDELGSGTDPAEGSVLAMAILEELIEKDALTVSTSHHGLLKNFGYTRSGAMNASMDFDESSHMPTYRVISGIPGESHAFAIAQRSGMPQGLLDRAEHYRQESAGEVGTMIRELESQTSRLRSEEQRLNQREKRLREEVRENDLKELRLRRRENELRKEGYRSLDAFMHETRRELENLVRELREGEINRDKTLKVKEFIGTIEERSHNEKELYEKEQKRLLVPEDRHQEEAFSDFPLEEGQTVFVSNYQKQGVLIRKEKRDRWIVAIGPMKLPVAEKELRAVKAQQKGGRQKVAVSYDAPSAGQRASFVLDLRGMRLQEAIDALIKQIDAALVQGLREFSVIHGTGEGILQRGIHDYLRGHKAVESYEFAHPDDGGAGKTVVRLG